ncbi:ketopantoate reductase family protein [Pleurocapsa sp. PCC 7319]|uniref:ketopantoate reductase family protein n=1 Tax=Pleurocapsa sp. PCC 7319 TaxID=118161 RepID=UPI00034C7E9E|nr:2-dehydropantoate 2-reductase N-terminal domain-containing protein [Pleurocapsa sp. PCC 7319]
MNNILVIGAGSVGALMGASLIKAGLKVTFAGKPNSTYTQRLQNQGLQLYYANGERLWISPLHPNVNFTDTATYLSEKFDIIIVALKSNDLIRVTSYIQSHSTPDTILIHAQNGIPYWWFDNDIYLSSLNDNLVNQLSCRRYLDSVDQNGALYRALSDRILVGCVVKAPCQRNKDGKVQVKKPPKLILGLTKKDSRNLKLQVTIQRLCDLFSQYGVAASYTNKIRTAVCNKLAVNVTTNVLSALTGRVIADLTSNHYTNSLIKTVIAEINHVFGTYGIKAEDLPTEQGIYAYITAPGSQSHLPSLAQDFSQRKPGEISLITAPVEMAQIAQINVPTLLSLSELLKLGQDYNLNISDDKSNILTLEHPSGCSMLTLTDDVCQSSVVDKLQFSNLLVHLLRVNASAMTIDQVFTQDKTFNKQADLMPIAS